MTEGLEIRFLHPFLCPSDHAHSIQILNTCRALAEEGARVHLMVKPNPDRRVASAEEALAAYGLAPHARLAVEFLPGFPKFLAGLAARWKVRRAEGRPVFYARHLRLAQAAAGRGTVVVELHKFEEDARPAAAKADGIVTITSALAERVRSQFSPRAPIETIPDGVDSSRFAPVEGSGEPRLVYTGQFHDWKGVDVLIRALAKLPGTRALIVGGPRGRETLEELARREGVAHRIEWAGFLPQDEMRARLRRGDIGLVPTRAANGQDIAASPLKLFEYMASGLPVLASDLPAIRDVVRDGENGVLFREGDADALAAAAARLVGNASERDSLAAQARKDAERRTWSERARRILAFVKGLRGPA